MNPINALGFSSAEKSFRFLVNVAFIAVLARLLEPKELGVFAMLWSGYQILQSFFGSSLVNAYLRSTKTEHIRTKFFLISILIGLAGAALFIVLWPVFELIFNTEFGPANYLFISCVLFLTPINAFYRGILQGRSKFDKIAAIEAFTFIMSITIALTFLLKEFGIFSLSIRYFSESILLLLMFYKLMPLKVDLSSIEFSDEDWRLFKYSFGLSWSRLTNAITSNSTNLFVGYYFPLQYVAYFSYSQTLAKIPDSLFRTMITSPALTYLGKYKGKHLFQKCQLLASAVLLLAMIPAILIYTNGSELLVILMGDKWIEFSLLFEFMGIFAVAQVIKGWLTIIYTNLMKMVLWNKIVFIELLLIFLFMIYCFYSTSGIDFFVKTFSLLIFSFWSLVYLYSNIRLSDNSGLKSLIADLKLLICPVLIFYILSEMDQIFINPFFEIALNLTIIVLITFIFLFIFDRASLKWIRDVLGNRKNTP
jgi:O-antigen/teichoic acid export membrane protein